MKINPKTIIKKLKKLPKTLAKHSFSTFLIFLLLDFVLAGIVFYKYVILIEKTKVETLRTPLRFDHTSYQEVLNQWEKRQNNLEKINSKQYINPFQEIKVPFSTGTEEIVSTSTEEIATTSEEISGNAEEATSSQTTSDLSKELIAKLLFASNIFDFYKIKKEKLPSVSERGIVWEEKGFGKRDDYYGNVYQNMTLLQALKKDLTK